MKKKFKLFATIGSLALAVCMMTIGVLAAATVTLTVNSTVSFNSTSVYVDVVATVSGGTLTAEKTLTVKNYDSLTEASNPDFTGTGEGFASNVWTLNSVGFEENSGSNPDGQTVVYTFTITNPSATENLKVIFTPPINSAVEKDTPTTDSEQLVYTLEGNTGLNSIAPGDDVTITYTLELQSVAKSLTEQNVNFVFLFEKA